MDGQETPEIRSASTTTMFTPLTMDALIRFSLILLLAFMCFRIITPFLIPMIWGLIIAVALNPFYEKLVAKAGGKKGLVAGLLALAFIGALVVPTVMMANSAVDNLEKPITELKAGTYQLPALPEKASSWPVIGKPLANVWAEAEADLPEMLRNHGEQVKAVANKLGGMVGSTLGGILQSIFSLIIAAMFWTHGEVLVRGLKRLSESLFGVDGPEYVKLSGLTIQSVAQGVIGVAAIQAVMATLGMVLAGVPAAGLWALLVLVLAVAQLPPILVLGPVAAYLFSVESTLVASAFLVWAIIVSASDAVLKPMLLGRGVDIPMIIILIGALGGMMMSGILGLFTGAVMLGLAYKLGQNWVMNNSSEPK